MTQPVQINVYNTRGDIVAAHPPQPLKIFEFDRQRILPGEVRFVYQTLHDSTILPAVRQLQYEMLKIWAEKVGRIDLVPSVDSLQYDTDDDGVEYGYYEVKIPLGKVRAVGVYNGGDSDAFLKIRTGAYRYLNWEVSVHYVASEKTSFSFNCTSHCRSGGHPCSIVFSSVVGDWDVGGLGRVDADFETEKEYETAMGLFSALQELLAEGDSSILQELLQRCPQYESTHTILRAPLPNFVGNNSSSGFLAYVLDMGADSVEITNDTKLSELIDVVNSEAYRTYHGLEAGSSGDCLLFELYVSLLPQPEAERV